MRSTYRHDREALVEAVRRFRGRRLMVVGDVMLARFIWGAVSRISPEAPVPVVEIQRETTCLGGAANVAANTHGLGGVPVPLGVIGDDDEGKRIVAMLRKLRAPTAGLVVDKT